MYARTHTRMHAHTHARTRTHTHTHTRTRTHTHTHSIFTNTDFRNLIYSIILNSFASYSYYFQNHYNNIVEKFGSDNVCQMWMDEEFSIKRFSE